jgi:hypothetical protein
VLQERQHTRSRFMPKHYWKKRTPDELQSWSLAKDRIAEELKEYYRACTREELPPQLATLLKAFDEDLPEKQHQ